MKNSSIPGFESGTISLLDKCSTDSIHHHPKKKDKDVKEKMTLLCHEASVCLQSFSLGLGVLSSLYFGCSWQKWFYQNYNFFTIFTIEGSPVVLTLLYCCALYLIFNLILYGYFKGPDWDIAVRACFLGSTFGCGVIWIMLSSTSYRPFGFYLCILSFFHFSEYLSTALFNSKALNTDLFLLNHSISYWIAAAISWLEFFTERYFLPNMKELWYITCLGVSICVFGEVVRKLAMKTAHSNFNHIVQSSKQDGHELVTNGIYALFRHPSYVGWFWWSVGTQITLVNPLCIVAYAAASWIFFCERITYEEITLVKFFGQKYIDYKKKVCTGLPFIDGYEL